MKVLHIISGGDTGGAKTHVLTLLNELKNEIDVSLLCVMEGKFTKEAIEQDIKTTIIYQKHRFDFGAISKIKKHITDNKFDLIHCHGARANYIATMLTLFGVKTPFLSTVHSDYLLDFSDNLYKKVLFTNINIFALKRFNYLCAITENFKTMLLDRGFKSQKIYTIYNGINTNMEINYIDKVDFLNKYGIKYERDTFYVGLCARLNYVKGIETFIKASNELRNYNIAFLIAGSGEEKEKYLELKRHYDLPDLHFLGQVDDIFSFYNAIDVNTLTSLSESFPYALLEGGLMKKATVASSVGGIPEMIENHKSGLLFKKEDYKALAELILSLKGDILTRNKLGEAFHDRIVENFSAQKMKETHIEIYKNILQEQKKAKQKANK